MATAHLVPGTDPIDATLELFGGVVGGIAGGRLPDLIEPATSPNHRDPAHASLPCLTIALSADQAIRREQEALRMSAAKFRHLALVERDPVKRHQRCGRVF